MVIMQPVFKGTGFVNWSMTFVYSWTVSSSAETSAVEDNIVDATDAVIVAVPVSTIPKPFEVSVLTVTDTGENEIGFLSLSILN